METMDGDFEVKQSEARPVLKKKLKQPENLKELLSQAAIERFRKLVPYLLMASVLVAAGFAGYFWYEASALRKDPQRAVQEETQKLLSNISALIVLPEGETPTVATVTDLETLKDQPFFAKAQIGDKVFIYTNSRKAILYNPATNKIVEVAPVNIGDQPPAAPAE